MSQQKVFFALVVVAGCVALAQSQNIDFNQCTQTGQQLVSSYAENMQKAVSKFTSTAAQTGQSTFDVQKINDQTSQMMKEVQKLVNPNSFNFEQTMSTWMNLVRMQTGLMTSMFNPAAGISMGRAYLEMLNTIMNENSNFALTMTSACVPALRANYNGAN